MPLPCFVSYSWSNSRSAVSRGSRHIEGALGAGDPRKIKEVLESKGIPCWLDIEQVGQVSSLKRIPPPTVDDVLVMF